MRVVTNPARNVTVNVTVPIRVEFGDPADSDSALSLSAVTATATLCDSDCRGLGSVLRSEVIDV